MKGMRVSLLIAAATLALVNLPANAATVDDVIKAGVLRVCTPGDYRPFSFALADGSFEGLDIDLMQSLAASLGVKTEFVKTSWKSLLPDFVAGKCDIAVGGISVTLERQKQVSFSTAYMVNGKTPLVRCADVQRFQTVADIDKPEVRVVANPGGSNERFARANFKTAKLTIHQDNLSIFDEVLKGVAPRLAIRVENRLKDDGTQMGMELNFSKLEDFEPQNVVNQVEPLKKLLEVRTRLSDLKNKISGNDKFEELLDEIMRDTEKLKKIGATRPKKGG